MPDTIPEKNEREPLEEFRTQMKVLKEKFNSLPSYARIKNSPSEIPNPKSRRKGRFATQKTAANFGDETLRNIKELKKVNKQLKTMEKRIARRTAIMKKELTAMKRTKKIRTKIKDNYWVKIVELEKRITKLEFQKQLTEKDALIKKLKRSLASLQPHKIRKTF